MKTAKIAGMKYPIVLVDSVDEIQPVSESVQCLHTKTGSIQAYFFDRGRWFSAIAQNSVDASVKIAASVDQFIKDCAIICEIDGVSFPVRHRSVLHAPKSSGEACASIGVIYWWMAGYDDEPYYKCDIHHLAEDGEVITLVGTGLALDEALHDVTILSIEYGFDKVTAIDDPSTGGAH